jgi:hypothetical protein
MSDYFVGDPIIDNTAHPDTELKQRHVDEISKQVPDPAPVPQTPAAALNRSPSSPHGKSAASVHAIAELSSTPVAKLPAGTNVLGEKAALDRDTYYVTPEDGAQMLKALSVLQEQGVTTRVYKKGFLIRRGADEWYFEFHLDPAKAGATGTEAARDHHGLPPSNAATVELWGFRGVRKIHGRAEADWTPEERAEVERAKNNDPLLYAGHIGISVDGGKTIIGFNPKVPADADIPEVLQNLFNHEAYPGVVQDDTPLFDRAKQRAAKNGWNTEPVVAVELVDKPKKLEIVREVERLSNMEPGTHGLGFSFPLRQESGGEHFAGSNGYQASCVRNCAAFPEKVGVPIPEPSGNLKQYMPKLDEWANADGPQDFRNQKGGDPE